MRYAPKHFLDTEGGYLWTQLLDGRAKTEGRVGIRPWKFFRACTCRGGRHNGPGTPHEGRDLFRKDGNPRGDVTWNTDCPLSAFETENIMNLRGRTEYNRPYARWSTVTNRLGEQLCRDSVHPEINEFLIFQDANPENIVFHKNSGRKSNGRLCDAYKVPYPESMDWHADTAKSWKNYQPGVKLPYGFKRREQSRDPQVCIRGHLRILRNWGRGKLAGQPAKVEPPKMELPVKRPRPCDAKPEAKRPKPSPIEIPPMVLPGQQLVTMQPASDPYGRVGLRPTLMQQWPPQMMQQMMQQSGGNPMQLPVFEQ